MKHSVKTCENYYDNKYEKEEILGKLDDIYIYKRSINEFYIKQGGKKIEISLGKTIKE